jgi:putative hydrolase of the HAD superfamily
MTEIVAVWSDFGGVLTPPISQTFGEFAARKGVSADVIRTVLGRMAEELGTYPMAPLEIGAWTEAQWAARMNRHIADVTGSTVDFSAFGAEWFTDREPNTQLVEHLRTVRARGYRLGMLTNNVREWESYWRAMVPVEELFEVVVNSCEVGLRKPDPRIFRLASDRMGVRPEQCVIVDDIPANCEAARALGWTAVHFLDTDQAVAELEAALAGNPVAWVPTGPASTDLINRASA